MCVCVCVCVRACVHVCVPRDHAGGNEQLVSLKPGLKVCGNDDRIGALNYRVKHDQELEVRYTLIHPLYHTHIITHAQVGGLTVRCLETPCHTTGHICYYVTSKDNASKAVFTGIHIISFWMNRV